VASGKEEGRVFFQVALAAVGLGAQLLGSRKQSQANQQATKAQAEADRAAAKVAEQNAILVDEQIADAFWRGHRERGQIMVAGRQVAGRQTVGAAAANLDTTFGSPMDAIYNTRMGMSRDLETSERNTQGEVTDLRRQKLNFSAEAEAARRSASYGDTAARNQRTAGTLTMLGQAASGIGQIYKARITQ